MYVTDRIASPPLWLLFAIFVPLSAILTTLLLRPVKGGTVALMVSLGMLKPDE